MRYRIDVNDTSYYKTEVTIAFEDGEAFRIRPDIYRHKEVSVWNHLRQFVEHVAGQPPYDRPGKPGVLSPEVARECLAKYGLQQSFF